MTTSRTKVVKVVKRGGTSAADGDADAWERARPTTASPIDKYRYSALPEHKVRFPVSVGRPVGRLVQPGMDNAALMRSAYERSEMKVGGAKRKAPTAKKALVKKPVATAKKAAVKKPVATTKKAVAKKPVVKKAAKK